MSNSLDQKSQKELFLPKPQPLDDIINLVDQWLAEESEYDQEVYPQLEVSLANASICIQVASGNE